MAKFARIALTVALKASSTSAIHMDNRAIDMDAPVYGDASCPCVGIEGVDGFVNVTIGGSSVDNLYSAELGSKCMAWDEGKYPGSCDGTSGAAEDWCGQSWCYVDPCNCGVSSPPHQAGYLPGALYQGNPVYYSYVTCGAVNSYDDDASSEPAFCSAPSPAATYGDAKCKCIGIDHLNGFVDVTIGGQVYSDLYPADLGSECQAWDFGRAPGSCDGSAENASWCEDKWCYVDPCSCDINTLPKPAVYLPNGKYQGNPIYYSYATCGHTDQYTGADGTPPTFCGSV